MSGPPIDNWSLLTGPSGWFELRHPPQWRVEEDDARLKLAPPGSEAELAVQAIWTSAPDQAESATLDSLPIAWPEFRNLRTVPETGIPHCRSAVVGESAKGAPTPSRRPLIWRACRVWVLRKGPILIAARLTQGPEEDPELSTLCRMLLQSIEFSETPAAPPDVFVDRVLDLARRRFPLLSCQRGEELQVSVGESTLNLLNFYRTYVRAPDRFDEIVLPALTTVVQVQEWGDAQTRPPLERVRDRIMPMLYPEAVWQERFAGFVGAAWVAGLAVLYVVDEPHAYWYIPHELLDEWQITQPDLHSLSLANLERYFEQHPMELAAAGTEGDAPNLLMPVKSDAYNAARVVSDRFAARLRESIGGDLVVGVPGRDFFVAVSLKSPEMLEHVRGRVHEDFATMDHPLTDRLLLLTADGACEFCDPETV